MNISFNSCQPCLYVFFIHIDNDTTATTSINVTLDCFRTKNKSMLSSHSASNKWRIFIHGYNFVMLILLYVSIEYKRPKLRDVYKYVVPQYAHKWRYLGALLHFEQAELDIIFSNFRNDAEECCRNLLSRWLEKSSNATWHQLFLAIDDLPLLSKQGVS